MNYYTDRYTTDKLPGFEDVLVPIKFLQGSKEPKVIAKTVNYMTQINPRCSKVIIQGFGHEHPLKNPSEFKKELIKFFTEET